MSAEVKNEKKVEEPVTEREKGIKGLLKIAEVRMLLYVIPVALILFLVASLLSAR